MASARATRTKNAQKVKVPNKKSIASKNTDQHRAAVAKLKVFNTLSGLGFVVLIVALFTLSEQRPIEVMAKFLTPDALLSRSGDSVVTVGVRELFTIDVRWLLAIALATAAIMRFVWLGKKYKASLEARVRASRFSLYIISLSGALLVVALLSGLRDITTLILIVGSTIVSAGIMYSIERAYAIDNVASKYLFSLAIIAAALPQLAIIVQLMNTLVFGIVSLPKAIYGMHLLLILAGFIFIAHQLSYFMRIGRWKSYYFTEFFYGLIELFVVAGISILLILL